MFHFRGILYGIVLGLIEIFIILLIISSSYKVEVTFNNIGIEILWYIVIFFCVAISEELMSRGFIFQNLYKNSNKHLAILISSLIFSLLHSFNSSFNIFGMINILLIGILLCLLYLKNMNLSIPIGFHFSWNLLQGPILGFSVSGLNTSSIFEIINKRSDDFPFSDFGLEGSLISTIVLGVFVIYFYFFNKDISGKIKGSITISNNGVK
ncbi:MAG: CPBP family intramembrane metalloprotease [Bacteroidetes bacterium]|nr:CPBP family intramembrane metalloprotease [Bacteroidota bacterium]